MFERVLIAEDQDYINSGVKHALEELGIPFIDHVQYCDEALLKIKNADRKDVQFDLLICDLSFVKDHNEQRLASGEELIAVVKKEFPTIKIIVFSVEDKSYRIQNLYNTYHIEGYVWKSRDGLKELKKALRKIYRTGEFYISHDDANALHVKNAVEITTYDAFLIQCLSKGYLQEAISEELKKKKMTPSSVSTIEKRLKFLKEHFNANNPAHLVAIAKDIGLI